MKTDHESEYALGHKAWKPRNVGKEVPANREIVNRNPRLFIVTKDHADTEQANRTSFERPGKLAVSEVCISPWIANVSLSMRERAPDARVFNCACLYLHPPKLVNYKLRLLP